VLSADKTCILYVYTVSITPIPVIAFMFDTNILVTELSAHCNLRKTGT